MIKWLKRLWKIHIKRECPACGGRVYCKGGDSETEACIDCIWDEFSRYGEE